MKKVPTNDYKLYIPWARENTANNIYPCSIAEGLQSGDIYVNDGQNIESVFFWHYCGFGYISGKPSDRMLNDIYEKINPANISRIQGRIIPSFSWDSPERFLKDGFGYIALDQERVCAVAFSAAVSSDQIDIGVETHENYRRKGLAAILTNCMCDTIVKTGKTPAWAHSISNKGSMNTALKCGFVQDRINTVIRKRIHEFHLESEEKLTKIGGRVGGQLAAGMSGFGTEAFFSRSERPRFPRTAVIC